MALQTTRSLPQLELECDNLNLKVTPEGKKLQKDDYIKALREFYIQSYGGYSSIPKSLNLMLRLESPMLAAQYKSCKETQQHDMWETNKYFAEEKCFPYYTKVRTSEGYKYIGQVNKGDIVYTLNNKGEEVETKVLDTMSYSKTKTIRVKLKGGYSKAGFTCTPEHKIMTSEGWKEAQNLKSDDLIVASDYKLSPEAEEAFYGMIIGDCSLFGKETMSLKFGHSKNQEDYMKYKLELLGLPHNKIKTYVSNFGTECCRVSTIGSFYFSNIYSKFYKNIHLSNTGRHYQGTKYVSKDIASKFTWRSFAFLYGDDGSIHKSGKDSYNIRINTYLDRESINNLVLRLRELGVEAHIVQGNLGDPNKDYSYIGFNVEESNKFLDKVKEYLPESMSYKLGGRVGCGKEKFKYIKGVSYIKVKEVVDAKFQSVHCIKTDMSSFLVTHLDIMAHNCDGVRILNFFLGEEKYNAYSRNNSTKDFLPISYKENICLDDVDFSKITDTFILDSECICINPRISTVLGRKGVITETQLQAVTALLSMNTIDSIRIQREEKCPLLFKTFDCIYYNGEWLIDRPLIERRNYLKKALQQLQLAGFRAQLPKSNISNKKAFYQAIIKENGEGIVLKRIDSPYTPTSSRAHRDWVKVKRSFSESLEMQGLADTIDGFITGFEPGSKDKANANLVGTLIISTYLRDDEGNITTHEIAHVSSISDDLRKEITTYDEEGNPILKQDYYNKVVEVDGQCISARAKRLRHAVLVRFRPDRSSDTCILDESSLNALVL